MRIASITSPGVEHLVPSPEDLSPGTTSELVVVTTELPLAADTLRLSLRDFIYTEAAVRAERLGFDAIVVNTVADYGVPLMREAVSIPVIGSGEAGFRAGIGDGRSFSIVTVWPSLTQLSYERVLRWTGLESQCREIRYVLEEPELGELGGGRAILSAVDEPGTDVAYRVRASCVQAEKDGAEAIVLGCNCMIRLTEWLQEAVSVPVINPLREAHRAAEDAVRAVERGEGRQHTPNQDSVARLLAAVEAIGTFGAGLPANWEATGGAVVESDCGDVCAVLPEAAAAVRA